jgi:hypothetical protein
MGGRPVQHVAGHDEDGDAGASDGLLDRDPRRRGICDAWLTSSQ